MKTVSLSDLPLQSVSHNSAIQKQVMLASGYLPHLTNFSQARFAPGQVSPGHSHADMVEVFFVEEGSGEIEVDGQVIPLSAGVCVAVEVGEVHEIRSAETAELVLTYFGIEV